ncbi:MAG: hypothetical protein AB7V42_13590 [Thermoleophilia bacterium]
MSPGPDPRAALRGLCALVLDMVRVDPDRRPAPEMVRWLRDLSAAAGVEAVTPRTNRELLHGCLRLSQILNGPSRRGSEPRDRAGAPDRGGISSAV